MTIKRYTVAPLDLLDFKDDTLNNLSFLTNEDEVYNLLDEMEETSEIALDVFEVELNIKFI